MAVDAERAAVYQQTQRWLAAGCFEAMVDGLRGALRLAAGRKAEPTAAIIDSQTLRSTRESGERAGYDGAKRKKSSKMHMAVDTLGHLLALHVTPASAEDRGEVERLARIVQAGTGDTVDIAWVDQGYTVVTLRGEVLQALGGLCLAEPEPPERLGVQAVMLAGQPEVVGDRLDMRRAFSDSALDRSGRGQCVSCGEADVVASAAPFSCTVTCTGCWHSRRGMCAKRTTGPSLTRRACCDTTGCGDRI